MTEEDKTERNPQAEDAELADDNGVEVPERATEAGTPPEDRIEPESDSGPEQSLSRATPRLPMARRESRPRRVRPSLKPHLSILQRVAPSRSLISPASKINLHPS